MNDGNGVLAPPQNPDEAEIAVGDQSGGKRPTAISLAVGNFDPHPTSPANDTIDLAAVISNQDSVSIRLNMKQLK